MRKLFCSLLAAEDIEKIFNNEIQSYAKILKSIWNGT